MKIKDFIKIGFGFQVGIELGKFVCAFIRAASTRALGRSTPEKTDGDIE